MKLNRAGISFDVSYRAGYRGSWNNPPEESELTVLDWSVADWDFLAYCHGIKGEKPIIRGSLNEIVDAIIEHEYDNMLDEVEEDIREDFHLPDDYDSDSW